MNDPGQAAYDDQASLWNGSAGRAWVEAQDLLDPMLQPFEARLLAALPAGDAAQVLDVGCGTGSTTLAIARRLGPTGRVVGLDISAPMIAAAKARAERQGSPAHFICADAQSHDFEPGSFDAIVSRFGVMFFDEPVVAFSRLRLAAKPGAELACVAWRSAQENPFMTTAERAAAPLLPELPVRKPGAPGQFAFADQGRVQAILHQSGWTEVVIEPLDVACSLPESGLMRYLSQLGPVGLQLQSVDEAQRARVLDTVRAAFEPYVYGERVRFTAACWWITARRGG